MFYNTNDCSIAKKIPLNIKADYGLIWNLNKNSKSMKDKINQKILEFHEELEFDEILMQFKIQNYIECILPINSDFQFDGLFSGSLIIFFVVLSSSILLFLISQYYEKRQKLTIRSEGHFQQSESNSVDMKEYNSLIAFEHIIKNYGYKFHQKIEDNKILFESNKESLKNIRKQVDDMIKLVRIKNHNSFRSSPETSRSEQEDDSVGIPWKDGSLLQN